MVRLSSRHYFNIREGYKRLAIAIFTAYVVWNTAMLFVLGFSYGSLFFIFPFLALINVFAGPPLAEWVTNGLFRFNKVKEPRGMK